LYMKLHTRRIARGAVDLNLPEAKVKVNRETGDVDAIVRSERLDTHRLIEEFMISANEAVSEIMEENKLGFLFRVHETPDPDAAKRFLDVSKSLHVRVKEEWIEELTPQTYQKMLKAIEESPAARVLNFLLLRSMKQAYYSADNLAHFGLASKAYTHFTSPIRRYPDLIVHRLLKAFIHKSKKEAQAAGGPAKDVAEAALHCSQRERIAVDAERELVRIKQVRYAERHLGEEHTGTVVSLSAKGAFVELETAFVEGFIPIDRFGDDFAFNDRLYNLRGKRSGKMVQIGDKVEVQIVRTNPHLQQIELDPLNGGKPKRTRAEIQRQALEEAGALKGKLREMEPRPAFRGKRPGGSGGRGEERSGGRSREAAPREERTGRLERGERTGARPARGERSERSERPGRPIRGNREESPIRKASREDRGGDGRPGRSSTPAPGTERETRSLRPRGRDRDREEKPAASPRGEGRRSQPPGRSAVGAGGRERDRERTPSAPARGGRDGEKRFSRPEPESRTRAPEPRREKEEKKKEPAKDAEKRDYWKPEDFE
ncbi:MAG: RNB domain-containing ribonuclease, partial [Proteobacteria bacterium]